MSFTVIIPTHDHADTLFHSVGSVLRQTRQDFEIVIIGDGSPPRTHEVAAALCARDPRIRFVPFEKGERHGEAHRHRVLAEVTSEYVSYLADDDLWFPHHLEMLGPLLEGHDLAHTMFAEMYPDGRVRTAMYDARADLDGFGRMRRGELGIGLASGGHRLDAYRRLPRGWHPAPKDIPTDAYFWLQFLEQSWCRYASHKWLSGIHLSSADRRGWTIERRAAELEGVAATVADPERRGRLIEAALRPVLERALVESLDWARAQAVAPELAGEELRRRLPVYALGQNLIFSLGGTAFAFPHTGFHSPEPWGVWTAGDPAQVVLPVPEETRGDLLLTLVAQHFVVPGKRQLATFEVAVNRVPVFKGAERRRGPFTYAFAIPESAWRPSGFVALDFSAPLQSPARIGDGPDDRELGLGLIAMKME